MKTYRELLQKLSEMDPAHLDSKVCVCDQDDKYRNLSGFWFADGAEDSSQKSRRPSKGELVLCVEEALEEDYMYDEDRTF